MLPKRNTRLSSGTPRGKGTAPPMTGATKPKTATKTPRTSNVRQLETLGTPRKITVEFMENQTEKERENLSLAIASAMTDICTADTEKKPALNGLTKSSARAFINAGSKLDPAVVSYVEKLASERGLSEMLLLSDGDLKKNETYHGWEQAYWLQEDNTNAENYRFFEVIKFLTKNSKRHRNRDAATFAPTKGHDCTLKQISDFALTLLLVLRDAAFVAQPAFLVRGSGSCTFTTVETEEDEHDRAASKGVEHLDESGSEEDFNEQEYAEYTREDLLCRVAKFVMFGGLLVAEKENFQSSARSSGRRWPRFYKHILDICQIDLPESVASNSIGGRNAERKEDPFDLNFKEEVISHILMVFFRGNDCATPYVRRIYGFFKKVHQLKNAPRNMKSAKRVGATLFDLRGHFIDQFLLWGAEEDETLSSPENIGVLMSENHAGASVDSALIDTALSSSPGSPNHQSLMYETPKRPHRGAHSKDKLLAALESLAGDPTNPGKYSEVIVFAHESYPQLDLLLGYYFSDPLSPAAKRALAQYCRSDGNSEELTFCSEEEREFVNELRNLKRGNQSLGELAFLRSLLPLFKSSDKFYGDTECDTLEKLFAESWRELMSEPRAAMNKGRGCSSSLSTNGLDDMEIKASAISFSPTDTSSLGRGVADLPMAPTYTAAGILRNLEAFYFAQPSKDACRTEQKDGKLVDVPVFTEEVKQILERKHQVPLDENGLALAGYRTDQCHMRIIRFVDHGAMGFVFLAKHLPSGKLVALKFEWFHSWDVGDYLIRVLVNHSAVNDDSHVMTLYDWWVVTHDGQHNVKPTQQGRSAHNSTAVKKQICVDGGEDEHMLICIASEWCPGGTFKAAVKNRVNRGTLTVDWILEHAYRLAQGLVRFSNARVVHRDLKPGNILFGDDGIPKIADFGLVRKPTDSQEMGTKGAGTPGFRNVAGVLHGTYDSATDVTGLGYTLREVFLDLASEESTKEKTATEVVKEETAKQQAFTTQRMEDTVVDGYRHRETLKELHRIILHAIVECDEDRIPVQDLELQLGILHKSVSDSGA